MVIHVSQACLGGIKKNKGEIVRLYVEKDGQKLLLGMLSPEKFPHQNFDVIFEDAFELFHDGKNESVHFAGYKAANAPKYPYDSDGERVPIKSLDNGTSLTKEDKPAASGKAKVKIVEPSKNEKDSDSDSDESDDSDKDDSEDDSDSDEGAEGKSDDDSSDDESEEETPKKLEASKKRVAEASSKTPRPEKKAKFATPVKNDGKKPVPHVDTPYPSKQAGKLPANNDKSKQKSPKSGGSVACNSCDRSIRPTASAAPHKTASGQPNFGFGHHKTASTLQSPNQFEDALDGSLRLLDVCGSATDVLVQAKECTSGGNSA